MAMLVPRLGHRVSTHRCGGLRGGCLSPRGGLPCSDPPKGTISTSRYGRIWQRLRSSARPKPVEQLRIGIAAEPWALRNQDAASPGMDRLAQRSLGEVAVEALDQGLRRHRRDAVDRGQQPGAEVGRMRDDLDAERL